MDLAYELLWRASAGLPVFWGGADAFSQRAKLDVLSPRLRRRFRNETSWQAIRPIHERFMQKAWEKTPVKWMTYLDLNLRLPELLLMRLDKMGMGASLETRVPFLDHKFVELAMSIPEQVITRGDESKHILKKAVRGLIPDDIIDRRKQGFGVPIQEWFLGQSGEFARRELTEFCDQTDFLDRSAVMKLIRSGRGTRCLVPAELCPLVEAIYRGRGSFFSESSRAAGGRTADLTQTMAATEHVIDRTWSSLRNSSLPLLLVTALFLATLTLWIPAYWPVGLFEIAVFLIAGTPLFLGKPAGGTALPVVCVELHRSLGMLSTDHWPVHRSL